MLSDITMEKEIKVANGEKVLTRIIDYAIVNIVQNEGVIA